MNFNKTIVFFLLIIGFTTSAQTQINNDNNINSKNDFLIKKLTINRVVSTFKVKGTSSIHDWEMISKSCDGTMEASLITGKLNIKSLTIKIESETLKSGKKLMEKKCYNALKTSEYPIITYQLKTIESIKLIEANKYIATLNGKLTIAGKAKTISSLIEIFIKDGNLRINTVNLNGEQPLKMTDFGITPPTALFGLIKTGDEISIEFNLNFT